MPPSAWFLLPLLSLAGMFGTARAGDDPWAELILSAAQAQGQIAGVRLELRSLRLPARLPPRPEPERTRVEFRRDEDFSGPTVVGLRVDGRRAWARADFSRFVETVTAARDLPAGALLQESDLVLQTVPAPVEARRACRTPAEAVGHVLRVAVKAGESIRADRLERPEAIRAGDRVSIEAREGAVRLRVAGQALAPGRVGDRIPVKNLRSGRRIEARVLEAGRVAVDPVMSTGGEP